MGNRKGYKQTEEHKRKRSELLKGRHINPNTEFKKGQEGWNYEGKGKLKRKFVKKDGKFMLNSHYVFCSYYRIKEFPKGFILHHKDGNSLNDSIDNLVMMTDKAHKEFHNKLAKNKFIAGDKLK